MIPILSIIFLGGLVLAAIGFAVAEEDTQPIAGLFTVLFALGLGLSGLMSFVSAMNHADDLGILRAQAAVISVQQQRLGELKTTLSAIQASGGPQALMNSDSPVKAIVDQIAKATEDLAVARQAKAQASVNIAKRKAGLFWRIPAWMGDH